MNMRTVNDPYGGNVTLVDKFIGNAYDTVRFVALNLAYVKHVSYHMKEVYDVAHNMADVLNVSANMKDVNTVASISEQIKLLAAQITGLVSLADNLPALLNIDENIAALIDLDKNVDNLVDLHSHQAEYLAVYQKLPAIETIIPKLEEIGAVFDNLTQVVAVGDNITAVKNVNDNMAKILSVEAELALINKVADDVEALVAEIAAVETGIYAKFAAPDGLKNVGQVATWAALATTVPTVAGQRVFLKEYAAGTGYGGGMMIAVNSAGAEDGGYRASVNANWHWRRDLTDMSELNVIHFGAVPDNTTDAMPAILRMDSFSLAQSAPYNRLGIVFPLGRFAVSTTDLSATYRSFFRLVGTAHSVFGYMNTTQLKLIGDDDSVAFKIQSRYTELANLQIIGQFDVDGKIRHWVKNICQAGQYVRGTCLQFTQHGRGVDMLDTLDVKFDQIYSSRGQNNVLRTLASGNTNGSWTHSTAFELTNFNIQYHEATEELKGALMLPNCGQSLIYNGWIEHSVQPGNLTKGQWMVQSLSMESSTNPLYMSQSRFINLLFSNPNNAGIDTETNKCVDPITGEYNNGGTSAYERGYIYINTYGARFIAPIKYERLSYFKRVSNITAASKWIYVGHFFMPGLAFNATLKINGRTGYSAVSGDAPASQEACIRIQNRGSTNNTVTWEGTPTGPILAVKYEQRYNNDTYVYIQVPAYSAIGIQLEGMGQTREETGTPAFVDWDMSEVADITAVANLSDAVQAYRAGTRAANIALNGSTGVISLTGSGQTVTIGELTSFLLTLNGTVSAIPMIGDGTVKLPVFYYSALPAASSMYWRIVILRGYFTCTDGNTYNTQPVFSDGTNWRPCQVPGTSVNGVVGS